MKHLPALFACFALASAQAEDVTLLAENTFGQEGVSATVTLNLGDSAKLLFATSTFNARLHCETGGKTFDVPVFKTTSTGQITDVNPIVIAGPAVLQIRCGGYGNSAGSGFGTLGITRAGVASPPTSIPQEAGATFDVILESSADLVNWLPVNPGEYSGTEARRFFRTRIVKKEPA